VGPTAVGKSPVAAALARELSTEVLTADSRQVYRKMDIGTAKPGREGVPRHLIDLVDPDEPFSVGEYRRRAEPIVARLHDKGKIPILEGGTGLYVRALLQGLWAGPPANPELRRFLREEERNAPGALYRRLLKSDPEAAARIHPNDRSKLLRAVEVYELTGMPISEHHARHRFGEERYAAVRVGLLRDRAELYRRIESRIDRQIEEGLFDEVGSLLKAGYSPDLAAMRGLGYRQLVPHLEGRISREEAVRAFKMETRRFAKRQLTWYRADPEVLWINLSEREGTSEAVARIKGLKSFQNMI
jgi:tRNA dimethylallyltransferase